MIEEKCANCKYIRKLYVPPIHKDIPKDAYVCALFGIDETKMLYGNEEKQVMYLSDAEGMCEMFSPKREWLEQEPCEYAINRQAVLSKIKEVCFSEEWVQFRVDNGSNGQRDFLINYIKQLPLVKPQPKTGHWSRKTKVDAYDIAGVKTWGIKCQCDRCNFKHIVIEDFGYYNYCPNCGARMESEE